MQHGIDPYDPGFGGMPQPTPSRSWKWPILILAIGGPLLLVLLCCGGGAGLMMFGFNVLSAEIEMKLRDHPQFKEHVGEVQSFKMDWAKSFAEEGDDVFVYDVRGSQGTGEITVESITNEDGNEDIVSAQLRLSSGEVIELDFE